MSEVTKENMKQLDAEKIVHTYGRFDVAIEKGTGATCYDFDGNKLIDFTSGIGVTSLGYCDPEWAEAVALQAQTMQHTSNLYYTKPQVELAVALTERTGMKKVFFGNSGAEANECAIKAARKFGNSRSANVENKIITLENAFHGRTMATLTATGQKVFHKDFFPFVDGFSYCKANDKAMLKALLAANEGTTCAIMMELVQGEGGVLVIDKEFVQYAEQLCRENDLLFIIDEVQTGIGRTGTLFCYEQYDVHPDIVTFAKGIAGGLPLGGALFNEKTADIMQPGDHGTTFGGNPVVCAGANVVMNKIDDVFLADVREKGEYLKKGLAAIDKVEDISGLGMMIGFRVKDADSKELVKTALDKGLMMLTAKDKVRLLPPLAITKSEIDEGLAILAELVG